jgi:hypothetical protein
VYAETLLEPGNDIARFARVLDNLGPEGRIDTILRLERKHFAPLFEAAKGFRSITLETFVPGDAPPLTNVVHQGKNSLAMFTVFQKHFSKPEGEANELWGFNHQTMSLFTGPGYFVVRPSTTEPGAVDFDYGVLPKGKLPAWPELRGQRGIGWFVYGGMLDVMRGISEHVSIGRGFRRGKATDNYFVLCRT